MDLQPGCVLFVAPRFYLVPDWEGLLQLGRLGEDEGRLVPTASWCKPTPAELVLLVGDAAGWTESDALALGVCLFVLPEHLRSRFWALLEQGGPGVPGFDPFVQEVGRFLAFKALPVPAGAVFDLVVCRAGRESLTDDSCGSRIAGLGASTRDWWGGVNLGEEAVSLLYIPLHPEQGPPRDGCPLVRVRIGPGVGFRLPSRGVPADVSTLESQEPGALLLVRHR